MKKIIFEIATRVAEALQAEQEEVKSSPVNEVRFYTVEDVCKLLHISKATLYRHKELGFVSPAKYVGRKPLFTQQSIDAYLNHFGS